MNRLPLRQRVFKTAGYSSIQKWGIKIPSAVHNGAIIQYGQCLGIGPLSSNVIATPGHSGSSMWYYDAEKRRYFVAGVASAQAHYSYPIRSHWATGPALIATYKYFMGKYN